MASLGRTALRGAIPLLVRTLLQSVLALVRIAAVARLLPQADVGLFGVAAMATEAARTFGAWGPRNLTIQREVLAPAHVETYWLVNGGQALVAAALVALASPLVATSWDDPRLYVLLGGVALATAVAGLTSPGLALAERESRFDAVARYELSSSLFDVIATVGLVAATGRVELAALSIAGRAAFEVALSYRWFPVPDRPRWHPEVAREYLRAGRHFFVIAVGSWLMIQGDNVLVGGLLGAEALGVYLVAYRLSELPFQAVLAVTNRVSFPLLSRVQSDRPRLVRLVPDVLELQLLFIAPVALAATVFAPFVVDLVYGPRWAEAAPVLQCLVLVTLGRGLSNAVAPILMATGTFALVARAKVFEVGVFVVAAGVGAWAGGLLGVALGAGVGYASAALVRLAFLHLVVGVPAPALAARVAGVAAVTAGAVAAGWATRDAVGDIAGIAAFGLAYVALVALVRGRALWALAQGLRGHAPG